MTNRLLPFVISAASLLVAGCGTAPAADPAPDPAALERFYAELASADSGAKLQEKLAPADRLSGTIAKVEPERIDASVVANLIAK